MSAIYALFGKIVTKYQLAAEAAEIEVDILNGSIDKLCLLLEKMEDDPYHDNFERIIDDIDNKYLIKLFKFLFFLFFLRIIIIGQFLILRI